MITKAKVRIEITHEDARQLLLFLDAAVDQKQITNHRVGLVRLANGEELEVKSHWEFANWYDLYGTEPKDGDPSAD